MRWDRRDHPGTAGALGCAELPLGPQRESMLRKAEQTETALRISEWLSSPVLRSSK